MSYNTIDELIQVATTTPDASKLANQFKTLVKRERAETLLSSVLQDGTDPLSLLDPKENTIPLIYILSAKLDDQATNIGALLSHIVSFAEAFSPLHARLVPDRLLLLFHRISTIRAIQSLEALRVIVQRYPRSRTILTPLHPVFIRACVHHQQFEVALPVLKNPITDLDMKNYPVTYLDNLIYHYSGGIALAVLKQWADAENFFDIVLGAPVSGLPSAIQLEAAKKQALIQLIRHGHLIAPPKYVHPMLAKAIKNSAYGNLAKAYPAGPYITIAEKEEETFKFDHNWGLVHWVIQRAPRWKLRTLTKTYLTLSLLEISKEIGFPNDAKLKQLVVDMIKEGEIHATLSDDNTLTFIDRTADYKPEEIEKYLKDAQKQTALLAEIDRELGRSRDFLSRAIKDRDLNTAAGPWGDEESMHWEDAQMI